MKILIADDHELYRDALSILVKRLDSDVDIHVVANYTDLLSLATEDSQWDLILIDLNMPGLGYFEGISQLTKQQPDTPIIVITSSEDPKDSQLAIKAGALGYISKSMKSDDILTALNLMLSSGISIHPAHSEANNMSDVDLSELTLRQKDVLNLMCLGSSNKRIALNLNLSEHTVKLHVRAILQALNVENRMQAVIIAKPLLSSNTPVSD